MCLGRILEIGLVVQRSPYGYFYTLKGLRNMNKKNIFIIIQNISFLVVVFLISGCSVFVPGKNTESNSKVAIMADIRQVLKENPKLIEKLLWENQDLIFEILNQDKIKLFELAAKGGELKGNLNEWKRLDREFKDPFVPVYDDNRPFTGKLDAPLKIIVYSDFQCVNCVKMAKSLKAVLKDNPELVTLYFKHYITSNNLSRQLAVYFEAIGEQSPELAWKFHDIVFENRKEIAKNPNALLQLIIAELALDQKKLNLDLNRNEIQERIKSDIKEAIRFGFKGTPIILINGVSIVGAQTKEKIEQIMKFVFMEGDIDLLKVTEEEKELCVECP